MNRLFYGFVALLGIGCMSRAPLPPAPTATVPIATTWPATLVAAHREATDGRHASADKLLADFATAYAGTSEAVEATYWRAFIALDPTNDRGSAREAATLLGRYLESRLPLTHRTEATVLRRLALSLGESSRSTAAAGSAPATDGREAELQRLKEELESTKAELERIRKRLAPPPSGGAPPPTPPPPTP